MAVASVEPLARCRARWSVVLAVLTAVVLGQLAGPPVASAVPGTPVSYVDHTYSASVTRPSQDKPQSKLWYLDGSWWALMVNAGGSLVHIHELMPDHTWRNTGTQVDARVNSTGDALWSARDGKLYVASRATGSNLQVNAFTYDSASRSWTVAPGFPITLNSGGGSESATIDQDSLGRLWVTYTRATRVWVAHSNGPGGTSWTAGFQPAVPDTVISADDLSALISFGDSIGLMWSDQESGAMRFAVHRDNEPDGVWRVEDALAGPLTADDHINLKQLVGDPQGRVFAAVKTSADLANPVDPAAPLVGVLTRTPGPDGAGTWSFVSAGTVADRMTRPIIMVDATNQLLYFFATAPTGGGDVYYKQSPLGAQSFPPGRGQRFVDVAAAVDNATGAKDPVTDQTGLVVLASADSIRSYVHAEIGVAGGTSDVTPPSASTSPGASATDVAVGVSVTATFTEPVQGVSDATFVLRGPDDQVVPATVSQGTGNQWVLDPATDLSAATAYTATLTGGPDGIRDLAGNPLSPDPLTWSFTTGTPDTTAPTAVTVPAAGATGVAVGANITATFDEPVQGVSGTTFTLLNAATRGAVSAAVTYDPNTRVATLNPAADLARGTAYTATLTGGPAAIRDAAGNPLPTTTWNFTTGGGDTVAPTVRTRSPADGATAVAPTVNVTATFSEAVLGVDTASFTLTDPSGAVVSATVSRNGTTNQWVLDPAVDLAPDTRFTAALTGGPAAVRDAAGNALASQTWSFLTGPAPRVSARSPGTNATGVRLAANVTATFSEPVQNVTAATFSLRNTTSGEVVTAAVSRNGTTNQWVLDPDAPLAPSTQYTVTVTGGGGGITDLAGNPLASSPVTWSFTTGTT
ncbi:Ig-like domain-containing protein [Geodermatophilus telluris]|uniref:Ig-like domain-containing protein n=2 Tax=Geodermatophilus telluris TaxID=1190417 RepID=A0A1G6JG99_9ACTN|nr:Ig-like domain-containing protein [Geodermatophilus telluris]